MPPLHLLPEQSPTAASVARRLSNVLLNVLSALSLVLCMGVVDVCVRSYSDMPLFRFFDCELLVVQGELMLWSNAKHDWIIMHLSLSALLVLTLALPVYRCATVLRRSRKRAAKEGATGATISQTPGDSRGAG